MQLIADNNTLLKTERFSLCFKYTDKFGQLKSPVDFLHFFSTDLQTFTFDFAGLFSVSAQIINYIEMI